MRQVFLVFTLALAGILWAGCGRAKQAVPPPPSYTTNTLAAPPARALVAGRAPDEPETAKPQKAPVQRKLIRNGTVRLEVDSVDSALTAIRGAVQALGGYISNESESADAVGGHRATVTCRVPAEKLDAVLGRVRSLGRLRDETITTEDITDRYFDLEATLANQKRLEASLASLLGRSGNKLSDLLDVERELARVRTDVDQLEGKRRLWDNQVALSTITVNIEGPRPALAADEGGIASSLAVAVHDAGENFVTFVAGLIAAIGWLAPLGLVVVAAFWTLRRLWRMWRRRPAAKS